MFEKTEDVVLGYAAADTGPGDLGNVDVVILGYAAHEWRRSLPAVPGCLVLGRTGCPGGRTSFHLVRGGFTGGELSRRRGRHLGGRGLPVNLLSPRARRE